MKEARNGVCSCYIPCSLLCGRSCVSTVWRFAKHQTWASALISGSVFSIILTQSHRAVTTSHFSFSLLSCHWSVALLFWHLLWQSSPKDSLVSSSDQSIRPFLLHRYLKVSCCLLLLEPDNHWSILLPWTGRHIKRIWACMHLYISLWYHKIR